MELNPDYSDTYKNLGISYIKIDRNKAVEYFKKSIILDSNNKEAYNNLAIVYYYNRQLDLAIENYSKALQLN